MALQNPIVALDRRQLFNGTGVSSYGEAVAAALQEVGITPVAIAATAAQSSRTLATIAKYACAIRPGPQLLTYRSEQGREELCGRDLFRVAQVHFDIYGRVMTLRAPWRQGVVHWTYPLPLRIDGWINLYTIHDLIPLEVPDLTPIAPRRHARLLAGIAATASGIITVSESTNRAVGRYLASTRLPVINCGSAVRFSNGLVMPRGIYPARSYLLVCGAIEPRKNLERVVAAYRQSGVALPLLIAGPDGWRGDEIRRRIGSPANVCWLGYQPAPALESLIANARALLMPSLAEGFGLPVAEAMALGTPVVTSSAGALAETAGTSGLLVDPENIDAIAQAIALVANDDKVAARLRKDGRERAEAFSTAAFARRLASAYDRFFADA